MDEMDIDHIVDVPDTPDRLTTRRFFQKSGSNDENHRQTIPDHSEQQKFVEEVTQIRPINTENGRKRLLLRLPKSTSSSSNSLHPKNIPIDLTDRINQRPESRKRPGLANGPSSSHGPKKISTPVKSSSEGTDNTIGVGSVIGNGNREGTGFFGNGQMKPGNNGFVPLDSNASPRINRQKRLVRNGCISPNNIAKAKEFSGKEINGSVAVVQNNNASLGSSASPVSTDIMDLVADGNNSYKGKGKAVVCQPCSSKETDSRNKYWPGRSSLSTIEKPKETNDYNKGVGTRIEETDGWISTRNPKTNISLSDEDQVIVNEMSDPKYAHQPQHTRTGRSEKGISIPTINDFTENPNLPSSDHSVVSQPLGQPRSNPRLTTRVRKRKPESALSRFEECSTSARDDPEIVLLSSPGEPSTSRTSSRRVNNLQPVIQVEDSSPELRYNRNVEDVRVRQLEADERLARELQEQFYNETPAFGAGEFDQHIAMALQHQDGLAPPPHRSSRPVSNARGSRALNVNRESQLHSSFVPRRSSHTRARAAALGRMTRRRSQFPGVGRTILPSAGSTSLFPPNMDIETRIHILGAMEAMEGGLGLLQTQRDFNENDYEMLLALDENNDQRGGASARVINGLPQSTVQSTTYEETCAVCLETPTIGDTIRHLPCLHKFHKECIDPWLRRKTSCPVCKSSVT